MQPRATVLLLSCVAVTFDVGAQPVKCVDASGRVRYIDAAMAGQEKCTPVRGETQIVPAQPVEATPPAPQDRPAERAAAPASTGDARLKEAQSRLTEARKKLAEQEAIREGGERNYARVEERLKPFQQAVESAEKEVEQAKSNPR